MAAADSSETADSSGQIDIAAERGHWHIVLDIGNLK